MSASKKSKKQKTNFKPYFLHFAYCLIIILLLSVAGYNLNSYLNSRKVLGTSIDITPIENEMNYWQNLVDKTPTFIDGYLQLAKLNVELGDRQEAENLIVKALSLDPNNTKVISVQKELGL